VRIVIIGAVVIAVGGCKKDDGPAADAGDARGDAMSDAPAVPPDAGADVVTDAPAVGDVGGDAAAAMLPFASGTRLKLRWSATPDGRRLFAGWFDSQLRADCVFYGASDGMLRCLPGSLTFVHSPEFRDSACTAPLVNSGRTVPNVYHGQTTCTAPDFVHQRDLSSGCDVRSRVFKRGSEVTGGMIFTKLPTSCQPTFLTPGTTAFGLGDELPAASFVKATRVIRPSSQADQLHPVYLEAEDGARQPVGWRLAGGDEDCRLLTLTDQRLHCLTSVGLAGNTFADVGCTQPTAYASACRPLPMFVERPEPGTCPFRYAVHRIGARLDRVYTTLSTGSCMQTSSANYYAVGSAVSADSFPTLGEMDEASGRPRRRFRVGPGGMMAAAWYDSERATLCRPSPVGDKLRCVPEGDGLSPFFADAACTTPVKVAERTECRPRFTFDYDPRSCPVRTRAFEVGAPYDGPVFEWTEDRSQNPPRASCQQHSRRPDYAYYQVKEIPESDLPELQWVVE
jgi:hypothetical protein